MITSSNLKIIFNNLIIYFKTSACMNFIMFVVVGGMTSDSHIDYTYPSGCWYCPYRADSLVLCILFIILIPTIYGLCVFTDFIVEFSDYEISDTEISICHNVKYKIMGLVISIHLLLYIPGEPYGIYQTHMHFYLINCILALFMYILYRHSTWYVPNITEVIPEESEYIVINYDIPQETTESSNFVGIHIEQPVLPSGYPNLTPVYPQTT